VISRPRDLKTVLTLVVSLALIAMLSVIPLRAAEADTCAPPFCASSDSEDEEAGFVVGGKQSSKPTKNPVEGRDGQGSGRPNNGDVGSSERSANVDPNRIITITQVYCMDLAGVGHLDCFEAEQVACPAPESQWLIRAQYPADDPSALKRIGLPFCSEPSEPVISDPAAAEEPEAPPMPVVTLEDFRRLDIAPSKIESDSGGFGLIRANTNFYATEELQTLNTTMLDQQVTIQAIPVQWTFDYGDGSTPLVSTTPGGPQREFNQQTTTSHAYQETGTFPVRVSTAYRGQFSVNGGPWIAIPGTASVPSAPTEADIWRSEAKNVAEDCHANPDGWACRNPFIED
jgi:hypothetical protein